MSKIYFLSFDPNQQSNSAAHKFRLDMADLIERLAELGACLTRASRATQLWRKISACEFACQAGGLRDNIPAPRGDVTTGDYKGVAS